VEEKIIKTEQIYKGRVVTLVVHDVELPDGKQSKRELVLHPGAVALVAFDAQQNVLMVRQYRTAASRILWEIPAGTLNPGEEPEACAVRELQEETGYKPGQIEALGGLFVAPGYTTEFIHLFLATDLIESTLEQDDDEFLELERLPLSEALAMIERGDIIDAKTITGLLRVARRMGV
jgi:ADP-ribose pyrophosphatase